ncbi:MAG: hypothetical protein RIR32_1138 [Verrucomicrobiota bacterium]|jgi:hypothetical protein
MSPLRPIITLLLTLACLFVAGDVWSRWSERAELKAKQATRDAMPKSPIIEVAVLKKAEGMTPVGALALVSDAAKAAGIQGEVAPVSSTKRGRGTVHRVRLNAPATHLSNATKLADNIPAACYPSSLRIDQTGSDGRIDLVLECEVLQLDP